MAGLHIPTKFIIAYMIYEFRGYKPVVHESSFIHPQAAVTGNVIIGKDVYIGPGAALRGDWGQIIIEDGCNVQENCTIHMFPGVTVLLKEGAHIGHGAIIHGATIGKNCLSDEMLAWKTMGTKLYQALPGQCLDSLKTCEPLREVPLNRILQEKSYTPLKKKR
jgi:phenylacetic acid degradation protein